MRQPRSLIIPLLRHNLPFFLLVAHSREKVVRLNSGGHNLQDVWNNIAIALIIKVNE
jgi:hypothetical protein